MPSIHQQMAKRAGTGSPKASRKGRWIIIIVVCLLLVGGGVAAGVVYALNHQPVDPRLAEVRDMRAEIMKDGELPDMRNPLNIVKGLAIYAKVKALPPELQQKFMEDMGNQMRDKMGARVKLVMSLPDDQRLAEIDKDLDKQQGFRSFMQMANGNKDGKPDGSPPGASGSSAGSGTPTVGSRNDADRKQRMNSFLSSIPVENRVQWNQYRQLMQARSIQRGMPTGTFGR
jgi:hypothetical protein